MGVNSPIVNNNFRDGIMQIYLFEGNSASSPNDINGTSPASEPSAYGYGDQYSAGRLGRYQINNDPYGQAAIFWNSQNKYTQQHTVEAYRLELGLVASRDVKIKFGDKVLNSIDNCLARRVAYGLGIPLPTARATPKPNATYPSQVPIEYKVPQPLIGLNIGIVTDDGGPSVADIASMKAVFDGNELNFDLIAPHQGSLTNGASAASSYTTTSSVFYDAVIVTSNTQLPDLQIFVQEAYTHGKPIGALGNSSMAIIRTLQPQSKAGLFSETSATTLAQDIAQAIAMPGRYPERLPIDEVQAICG